MMSMNGMRVLWAAVAALLGCGCAKDELACEPEKLQCAGNTVQRCGDDERWHDKTVCTGQTCTGGACAGECEPDTFQCAGNTRQSCGPDGRWQDEAVCPSPWGVCNAGQCVPGPNCVALPATCGPAGDEDCCASTVVTGGTYNRSNDAMYPATISDFRLDRFEITVGRFRAFVEAYTGAPPAAGAGAHPLIPGSGWLPLWDVGSLPVDRAALLKDANCAQSAYGTWTDEVGPNENLPMGCMTWFVAFAFCAWDGGRLPTEAEWNYAAAGGNEQREYPWSTPPSSLAIDGSYAVYACMGDGSPAGDCAPEDITQVGSRSPKGDGKWGHADLAGNVDEWTLDFSTDYSATPVCDNCASVQSGTHRTIRGGWYSADPPLLLTSLRSGDVPLRRSYHLGARCARPL